MGYNGEVKAMTDGMDARSLEDLRSTVNGNVFVMMRYRSDPRSAEIEACVRSTLQEYGLVARLAKDSALVADLWENIALYMQHSRFGLAVFEDIDDRDFNPNIALELGYMYAQGKRCLLLKEKRMPRLPTDILGKIYRDFDIFELTRSLREQIADWCIRDLRLERARPNAGSVQLATAYDNQVDDPKFRTWGVFSTIRDFEAHIQVLDDQSAQGLLPMSTVTLIAEGTESVGVNKDFAHLFGKAKFEYKAVSSGARNPNLLFCMIPMQGRPAHLLEVGAEARDEQANAYSPFRVRYYVPLNHIGDNEWHEAEIAFDFREIAGASYSIFAPRINEGCPRPGAGRLEMRNFRLLAPGGALAGCP
jgi:hypothetical protein